MIVTRADVTFYLSSGAAFLTVCTVLWRVLISRLATKEQLLKELNDLREFLRKEFVGHKEFDRRMAEMGRRTSRKRGR